MPPFVFDPLAEVNAILRNPPGGAARGGLRSANQLPLLTEEEEEDLLTSLGHGALSGISYVGGLLDKLTGSRALRGLLGGEPRELLSIIPGSDVFGITNPKDIVWGKDLTGDPWSGFAFDVLLDPTLPFTLGSKSALTAAGRALKAAGPELLERATKIAGTRGPREARMLTTPRQVLEAAEALPPSPFAPGARTHTPRDPAIVREVLEQAPGTMTPSQLKAARTAGLQEALRRAPKELVSDVEGLASTKFGPEVVTGLPSELEAFRRAATGMDQKPEELLDKALGGLIGFGFPFMQPTVAFGKAPRLARGIDIAGRQIGRAIPPALKGAGRDSERALENFRSDLKAASPNVPPEQIDAVVEAVWKPWAEGKFGEHLGSVLSKRVEKVTADAPGAGGLPQAVGEKFKFTHKTKKDKTSTFLKVGRETQGEIYSRTGGAIEARSARSAFPGVFREGEDVRRLHGIDVEEPYRGQKLGQALYLEHFKKFPGSWFYNSQTFPGATNALLSLQKKGLIELHWYRDAPKYGERGGAHLMRLAPGAEGKTLFQAGLGGRGEYALMREWLENPESGTKLKDFLEERGLSEQIVETTGRLAGGKPTKQFPFNAAQFMSDPKATVTERIYGISELLPPNELREVTFRILGDEIDKFKKSRAALIPEEVRALDSLLPLVRRHLQGGIDERTFWKSIEDMNLSSLFGDAGRDLQSLLMKLTRAGEEISPSVFVDVSQGLKGALGSIKKYLAEKATGPALFHNLGGSARGATSFAPDGRAILHLFENADVSTHLHEFAHIASKYLDEKDMRVVNRAMGLADDTPWENWTREVHERFAEGFESFIRSGRQISKAPSGLAKVFSDLRDWVTRVYANITGKSLAPVSRELDQFYAGLIAGRPPAPSLAQRAARGFDVLGEKLLYGRILGTDYAPGAHLSQLFSPAVRQTATSEVQRFARDLSAGRQTRRAAADLPAMQSFLEVEADPAKYVRATTTPAEGLAKHAIYPEGAPGLGAVEDVSKEIALRRMGEVLDQPISSEMAKPIRRIREEYAALLDMKRQRGIGDELTDKSIRYFTRRITGAKPRTGRRTFSTFEESQIQRKLELTGFAGGTDVIERVVADADLMNDAIKIDDAAILAIQRYGTELASGRETLPDSNRVKELIGWARGLDETSREAGVFANHPIADFRANNIASKEAIATYDTIIEAMSALGRKSGSIPAEDAMTFKEIFEALGIKHSPAVGVGGGTVHLARLEGWTGDFKTFHDAALERVVPRRVGKDLIKFMEFFEAPQEAEGILKFIDSYTNLFKVGVLTWPARYVRDLVSGQVQSHLAGEWSAESFADAWKIIHGGEVDALKFPIVKEMLTREGLDHNQKNAMQMLRANLSASDLVGARHAPQAMVSPTGRESFRGTRADLRSRVPGLDPLGFNSVREAFREGTWNPFAIRGFGSREETTFKLARAGNVVGIWTDALNRLQMYLNQIKRGVDPLAARAKTMAAQVDYSSRALTQFERAWMARLFPFYRFSKGMIPYVMQEVIARPSGRMAQVIRGGARARVQQEGEFTPEHIARTLSIPIPGAPEGTQRFFTGFGFMHEDPLSLVRPGQTAFHTAQQTAQEILGRANPLIKAPLELALGRQAFSGRELQDLDPTIGRLLSNIQQRATGEQAVPPETPILLDQFLSNSPLARAITTARTLTDPRKDLPTTAANLLTGLRFTDVELEKSKNLAIRKALEDRLRGRPGVRRFEHLYSPNVSQMTPRDQLLMALYRQQALEAQARARAAR